MKEREMRPAVDAWLEAQGMAVTHEKYMSHAVDVIGVRFAPRVSRRIPAVEKIVAVELKLTDVAGVIRQAVANRRYSTESYAAMPDTRYHKMRKATFNKFLLAGVGLLAVDGDKVWKVITSGPQIIQQRPQPYNYDHIGNLHRRLWGHLRHLHPWPAATPAGKDNER